MIRFDWIRGLYERESFGKKFIHPRNNHQRRVHFMSSFKHHKYTEKFNMCPILNIIFSIKKSWCLNQWHWPTTHMRHIYFFCSCMLKQEPAYKIDIQILIPLFIHFLISTRLNFFQKGKEKLRFNHCLSIQVSYKVRGDYPEPKSDKLGY